MTNNFANLQAFLNVHPWANIALIALALWSITWKGLALWRAAQQREKGWFILLLLVNSLGILEIIYLYLFSKRKKNSFY